MNKSDVFHAPLGNKHLTVSANAPGFLRVTYESTPVGPPGEASESLFDALCINFMVKEVGGVR